MRAALVPRGLTLAMLALCFGLGIVMFSIKSLHADVTLRNNGGFVIDIFNTISKADADSISQRATELEYGSRPFVRLNSFGGDVEAAMQIGRMIRKSEGATAVLDTSAKCYSSCALIYIAGLRRDNYGTIGLHRPYLASAPHSRQTIESQVPLMLQRLKVYVQEMGVTDIFYQEMLNTEPSGMRLYVGDNIQTLVPGSDPTFDEVMISYRARAYSVDTAEMRRRDKNAEKCFVQFPNDLRHLICSEALAWGLSERVYNERNAKRSQCKLLDGEEDALKLVKQKEIWDHPLFLKREACIRRIMLGR